jgi:hypothetical protein
MARDFRFRKRLIIVAVALLIAADLGLAAYNWQMGSSPGNRKQDLADQTMQFKLHRADIEHAKDIRSRMPTIQGDCDKFEHLLFPATSGYSSVTTDFAEIAKKSGAQVQDLGFKQQDIPSRGLTSVEITATILGNYSSVVHFVNGLQRSDHVYVLQGLTLAGESANVSAASHIKVTLHLQTYFRSAA